MEGHVLSQGRWVRRPMDLQYILSKATRKPIMDHPLDSTPPTFGLLTKTLVKSPVIKWIIPARIRHDSKNDVISVSEHSVEIKEFINGRRLQHVASTSGFGGRICAARVWGLQRKSFMRTNDSPYPSTSNIKLDEAQRLAQQILVIIVKKDRGDFILFLFAYHDLNDKVQFVSCQYPLPTQARSLEQFEPHMAVDPGAKQHQEPSGQLQSMSSPESGDDRGSRAMAIAVSRSSFILYAFKPRKQIESEVEGDKKVLGDKFDPIKESRKIDVDGVILRMEFLHPSRYDYQTVVLVLVVQNGSKTALMRYDWDCSSSLESTQTIINRHPTPSGLGMPLFLVPLTTSPGFILLGQKRLAVYSSFAPGSDKADVSNLEEEFHSDNYSPIHPGTSKEFPLLTTWARPMRRDGWADEHAFLYFCREDGLIIYFDFQRLSNRLSYAKVGELNINIGTAFAILTSGIAGDEDGNQGSSDTLVAAGSMSNGGLFRFRSRQPGHQLQPIPNWSPVLDFTVVERQINPRSDSPASLLGQQDHAQARLFVCAGEGDFGSLYELRKAIEAQTVTTISLDDDNKNSTTIQRIWLLPALSSTAGPEDGVHLLASYHDQTHVIYVGAGQDVHDDIAPHLRALVDLESKTIAAGTTTSGFAIQVTPRMITAVNLSASMEDRPPIRYPLESDLVLQASVDGISGSVIVIVQTNVEKTLRYSRLLPHSKQPTFSQPTRPVTLRQDPTCVLLQNLDSGLFVFVGTFDGSLLVYRVFENNIVTEQRAVSLEADGTGCESIIVLADPSRCNTQSYLILCGLRNGALQVLRFEHESDQDTPTITPHEMISIGKIAVSVFPDHSWAVQSLGLATRAIVSEGGKLYRLFYDANDSHNPARIQSIQFTNQTDGEFKETLVHDIGQLAPWNLTTGPRAYQKALFCVGGSQIDIVQLDPSLKCQPVPRRLITGGTPSRVIFCRKINKLIVAISRIVVQPARNTNAEAPEHNNRLIYPGLKLLDPDDDSAGLPSTKEQDRISFGKSGERILGITEWQVDYAGQSYLMLLVPTMRPRRDQSHSSHSDGYNRSTASEGRIYLFNVQMSSTGIPALVPKTSMPCNDPVYSVAVYDPRSFVYGCGKKVCIRTLADHQSRLSFEWNGNAVATCNVGSPVKKITVNKPYIYATTAHDSIVVLRLENNQLIKVFSDSLARSGQHHLLVEEHSLIIGTHSDKHLCGLWQPPQPTVSGSLRIIFEAQLPGSIMRLQRVSQTLADVTNKNTLATFVGSAFDGAFYEFNVVDEAHWMLLRFIQNMAERSPAICPYTYRDTRDRSIIPSFEKYHYKQIDGDILLRILQQDTKGGHSTLQALVNAPPPLEDQHLDYGTAEERQARFIEFVENALGGHNEEDPYLRALHFLQEILQPMASDECY